MDEYYDGAPPAFPRVPTGIAGLDTVLRGGLLRGGIYMVQGNPGAGKTILANQMCFAHVAGGGRAVYVTLVSESVARMIGHLESLSFKRADAIGDALYYLSGVGALTSGGLGGLLDLARRAVRDRGATLLVLDGLATAQAAAGDEIAMRNFIQQLQLFFEAVGCTALLLTRPSDETHIPMQTMVDGVINLRDEDAGAYPLRFLNVQKFRGSGYLRGDHAYSITGSGIAAHPRIEALYGGSRLVPDAPRTAMPFDAPRLDAMLGRGIMSGSATILHGAAGSGKTMLSLLFLGAGVRRDEPGLYFGFAEQPPRLLETADRLGLALREAAGRGTFEVLWQPPLEDDLDALAERLLDAVERGGVRRLVLDPLSAMQQAALPPNRFPRFLAALTNELRVRDVTTLAVIDVQEAFIPTAGVPSPIASIAENIISLRFAEVQLRLRRFLSIIKMREGTYDTAIREMRLTDASLDVAAPDIHIEGVMSGNPRMAAMHATETTPASPQEADDADNSRR